MSLDFLLVSSKSSKRGTTEIYPKFIARKSKDLMIRGQDFYAIWDEDAGLWSVDEDRAIDMIDHELDEYARSYSTEDSKRVMHLWDSDSGMIDKWHKFVQKQMVDNWKPLDESLVFSNQTTTKEDYATRKLGYPLEPCKTPAYDDLMNTLYSEKERHKIEWAIGSVVNGDSKEIQKFLVLYGASGTGKSTVINIIRQLFDGYCHSFRSKALGAANAQFALEDFKTNPLVAFEQDGDLSRIEDNTRLNSLVSHETMIINEKFKASYDTHFHSLLIMGTNRPVKITDAKSGLIRRLIDVSPTGQKVEFSQYNKDIKKIKFELGGIATHCKQVYEDDPYYYDDYIPVKMMGASNSFYNFIMDNYQTFKDADGVTLKNGWEMYKAYCDEANVTFPFTKMIFREEMQNYFTDFFDSYKLEDGMTVRSYYKGFKLVQEQNQEAVKPKKNDILVLDKYVSIFDKQFSQCPAQYANDKGTPEMKWDNVNMKLERINTTRLHYVKVPSNLIVIDFDLKNKEGNKDQQRNLEEASKWPLTYAEYSKSGAGVHLHYFYDGNIDELSRIFDEDIEIKVFTGNSSLRRQLTLCNDIPVAHLNSGLPLKVKGEKKQMLDLDNAQTEKGLRTSIKKAIDKKSDLGNVPPYTKPRIDFIAYILDNAYRDGIHYDVDDLRNAVLAFAAGSSHNSVYCLHRVSSMHFKSEDAAAPVPYSKEYERLIFFDCEVFPNLFLINWKFRGKEQPVNRMINPNPEAIEELLHFKLVGFNNRKYDNHLLYARTLGYNNEQIFNLSMNMIRHKTGFFGEAYNLSYTDILDYCSAANKMGLKKWEIKMRIHHKELGLPWDKPVPKELWETVAEYCDNDVISTEAVWEATQGDFQAREILAEIAGGTVNDTTNQLTTKFIFGDDRHPELVYEDLKTGKRTDGTQDIPFADYEYVNGKNMFHGKDMGRGGNVYGAPGIYFNVALLDIQSMHPHSIIEEHLFGKYTDRYKMILDTRLLIKHKEYEKAKEMFDGKIAKYLDDPTVAKALSNALKTALNSCYGLTSASFSNTMKDPRNVNNIVALRGALFMETLKEAVEKRNYTVVAIRTDSIKIAQADEKIIRFCKNFAQRYGYEFEHEATYDKMFLANKSAYIAHCSPDSAETPNEWTATAEQFQVPYVFKTLFSHEKILFDDMCETFTVSNEGTIFIDKNEGLPDDADLQKRLKKLTTGKDAMEEYMSSGHPTLTEDEQKEVAKLQEDIAKCHRYVFVGRVGLFCPVVDGVGGGYLYRECDGRYSALPSSKGYRWMETEDVEALGLQGSVNTNYYRKLVDDAVDAIRKYGDYERFVSDDPVPPVVENNSWVDITSDDLPF